MTQLTLLLLHLLFILLNVALPRLTTQMRMGQMPEGIAQTLDQNTRLTQGRTSLDAWSAECQGYHQTQHKGHTPSPRKKIKISDLAKNRTRAAGLVSRVPVFFEKINNRTFSFDLYVCHFSTDTQIIYYNK